MGMISEGVAARLELGGRKKKKVKKKNHPKRAPSGQCLLVYGPQCTYSSSSDSSTPTLALRICRRYLGAALASMEVATTISFLPLDLLGHLTSFLPAVDVINLKFVCRVLRSKLERGGLGTYRLETLNSPGPKSPTWLSPVFHSRLTELIIICPTIGPHLYPGVFSHLPNSLRCIRFEFENALSFLEPLPAVPGVTKSLQESYSMMKLDGYFPNLTDLTLVDLGLSWKLVETEAPYKPTSGELQLFVSSLPPSLLHLNLAPFPSLNGQVCNLPPLQSLNMHCTPKTQHFDLPPSLTSLCITSSGASVPKLDYTLLPNLSHLSFAIPLPHTPTLPASLESLSFLQGSFLNPTEFPEGLLELNLGDQGLSPGLFSRFPSTLKRFSITCSLDQEHLSALPQGLASLRFGVHAPTHRYRLGCTNASLSKLPPTLTSLTIEGLTRLTYAVWPFLPSSLTILSLPHSTLPTSFIKVLPPVIARVEIGILQFTFKEGVALIEETPACVKVPETLEQMILAKLVPKRVIFLILMRSECDVSDHSAALLPRDLRSLTVRGSHVGITDEFVSLLPPYLRTLRMPHQSTFTSRVISLLPPSLTELELDGYGLPDDLSLPPRIAFTSTSAANSRKLQSRKFPR